MIRSQVDLLTIIIITTGTLASSIDDDGTQIHNHTNHLSSPTTMVHLSKTKIISNNSRYSYRDNGNIPVNILIKPLRELERKIYVPTGANITAMAEILDEKFRNVSVTYQWSAKNKTITTDTNAAKIVYSFDKADNNNFLKVLVYHKPNDTGICQKDIVVRDPIVVSDLIGNVFLEYGELLNVTLKFNGTGPFKYCSEFCLKQSGKYCKECSPTNWTTDNEITIVKFLRPIGNYSLSFVVDNYASRVGKTYLVKIFDTVRYKTTPIVPIVCSITAVINMLTVLVLHIKFRNTVLTETADFEFIREAYEEEDEGQFLDEEQSFVQRVRYLLFGVARYRRNSIASWNLNGSRSRIIT